MKTAISQASFDQMLTLYGLRERKLLDSIGGHRLELENLLEKLSEQKLLIETLRDELQALHFMRSNQNVNSMSAQSFQTESSRRQWLTYDLEKEEFYLPAFQSDVADERNKLAVAERNWVRMRERTKALEKTMEEQRQHERHKQTRLDEAVQDEQRNLGLSHHG